MICYPLTPERKLWVAEAYRDYTNDIRLANLEGNKLIVMLVMISDSFKALCDAYEQYEKLRKKEIEENDIGRCWYPSQGVWPKYQDLWYSFTAEVDYDEYRDL